MKLVLDAVDEVIHGRVRLGAMAHLVGAGGIADFAELRVALGVTDGNLSVHLSKLEAAGHIALEKTYAGRRPLTRIHLTEPGRAAFTRYLAALDALLAAAKPA